jgi:hypothetical protein
MGAAVVGVGKPAMNRDQVREDIQTTSENVVADAKALTAVEEQKQRPDVSPEELERLSDQAEKVAHDLAHKATVEKRLVDLANAQDRLKHAGDRVGDRSRE